MKHIEKLRIFIGDGGRKMAKKSSLLSKIKQEVRKSGSSKGKILFIKADSKVRIRMLQNIEDGIEVTIHDSFQRGINALCQKHLGKKCPYCGDEDLRTRSAYVYNVWDVENKEVKLFVGFANSFNPLPSLVAMYENYGTLLDRDYVIQRDGSGQNTKYSVIPMDKVKFKNDKAKPYSEKKMLEILAKAYPVDDDVEDQTDDVENNDDEEELDYEEMGVKELFKLCKERGIKAKPKQKKKYYIELLEEWDAENEDDDEEDWDEDDNDEEEDEEVEEDEEFDDEEDGEDDEW